MTLGIAISTSNKPDNIYVPKWAVRGVDSFPLSAVVELRSMEGGSLSTKSSVLLMLVVVVA